MAVETVTPSSITPTRIHFLINRSTLRSLILLATRPKSRSGSRLPKKSLNSTSTTRLEPASTSFRMDSSA